MKTLWIAKEVCKEICKDIAEAIYDDVLPITPHSVISKREYKKIEKDHLKIIDFYNSLFNTDFSKPEIRFGRKWQCKKCIVYFGLSKRLDKTLYSLSHEEAHRFYYEVNPFIDKQKDIDNMGLVFGIITEGIAFYSCGKFMGEIGFEEISKGLEGWAHFHGKPCYLPNSLPNPVDVTKFLYSAGEEIFEEFVRLNPLEGIKILNPELKIENCNAYALYYPSIDDLIYFYACRQKQLSQSIESKLSN